jgi:endonuclease III
MNSTKKRERTERVRRMNAILRQLYPVAQIELNYQTPFELMVAVQLSAQCTDARVNQVTATLFKKYPTLHDYLQATPAEFERDIFACGFYRNKTKNILACARVIHETCNGEVPRTMDTLLALPGVARKTANVVLSCLYGVSEGIAVDTHVRRFAIRFDLSDYRDPVRIERDLMEIMPRREWWAFNHRLVHYGRYVCKARKHDCSAHPLTLVYKKAVFLWPRSH